MKTQSCELEAFLRSKDTFLEGISFSMVGNVRKWTVARVREVWLENREDGKRKK